MSLSGGPNRDKFSFEGIGIHSAKPSKISIKLCSPGTGIVFVKDNQRVKADFHNITETRRGTCVAGIYVTEHLLAACYAYNLFDLEIELHGDELPIMDGSALAFAQALKEIKTAQAKQGFMLKQKVRVQEKDAFIEAEPFDGFKVDFMVNFPFVGEQRLEFDLAQDDFLKEIAPARTFGYIEELEALKKQGLGLGASLENALGISKQGYINQPRFKDELVRHKILDLMGDLALFGQQIKAKIIANKSGHALNIELLRRIKTNG